MIRPLVIAAVTAMLSTGAALAAPCVSAPDSSATGNVQNNTAYMLCLQQQVTDQQQRQADLAHVQSEINAQAALQNLEQRMQTMYQLQPPPTVVIKP